MPTFVHSIAELRNRFSYNPKTGLIRWRDVPFIEWARGRAQSKQGHYLRWRREKAGKIVKFTSKNQIFHRKACYSAPRLAWALHYGSHPGEGFRVISKDGDPTNTKIDNLERVSDKVYGIRVAQALSEKKKKDNKYRDVPKYKQSAEILRKWMVYNPTTGNLHWDDIGWKDWKKFNKRTSPDAHDLWLHEMADKVVEFYPGRNGDQVLKFKGVYYERKMLTFAIVRGYHITNAVYLFHKDGDETNFRIENLKVSVRGDWVDPDEEEGYEDHKISSKPCTIEGAEWIDDDEEINEDEVEE
jgi:hypothetical protein